MAIYHCSVKIIGRSSGRSAVGSSAYRSGERLENERDGITHDYTKKSGVVYSEIVVPEHAPEWTKNRQTLWNEVEKIEKSSKAQLAREFELALPAELGHEQQKKIVSEFANDLAKEGMIVDVAMHDKGDGNPHAHLMATLRQLDRDGTWKEKQRKEYILDQNGNKQYDPQKKTYKCKTVKTTDWDKTETLEKWRENWSKVVNKHLEIAGHEQRIDHRSYKEQGIEQIPTIHEGAIARKIDGRENQISDRCEINRKIAKENRHLVLLERQEELLQERKTIFSRMEERRPAPIAPQKQSELPQQRQKEEIQPETPMPTKEPPQVKHEELKPSVWIEAQETTLGSMLQEVDDYYTQLYAKDMELDVEIISLDREIREVSKPFREEAIETYIGEKWGPKWDILQAEKRIITREIQAYHDGEGYSFLDKHVTGKYKRDGEQLYKKSVDFDQRESDLASRMNQTRNELSAGRGEGIGEVNRLADRIASEKDPRCQDRIQELKNRKETAWEERTENNDKMRDVKVLKDNMRKVKERSSEDIGLCIPIGRDEKGKKTFEQTMENKHLRERMKPVIKEFNAELQAKYRELRDHKRERSLDRGGRSR